MKTGEPLPPPACPGDPFARKYVKPGKALDLRDPRLYSGGDPNKAGTYIHSLCFRDDYGFADENGYCREDEGACPAQGEDRMCTCRDRYARDKALAREAKERSEWRDGVERIRRGELLHLNS